MSSAAIIDFVEELAWSLWTELGVPGVVRNHRHTVVDPEALLVATPAMVWGEPRLRELAYGWCAVHSERTSTSRLRGLYAGLPGGAQAPFGSFVATLRQDGLVRWSIPSDEAPWRDQPLVRRVSLDLSRPALLRLRMRGLCGVGARADVLCELLARQDGWVTAADLQHEGYSKRNIARVLSELQDAGVVVGHAQGNAQRYRLASPEELGGLVHDAGLAHPPWRLLLGIALCALEMAALEERPLSIQRTEAHKMAERVRPLAEQIRLDLPPATRGEANAWGMMVDWFSLQLEGIAQGTSPAFRVGAAVGRLVE